MNNRIFITLLALGFSSLHAMQQLPISRVDLKITNKTNRNFVITNSLIYGPGFEWHSQDAQKPINIGIEEKSARKISFDLDSTYKSDTAYSTVLTFIDKESNQPAAFINMYTSSRTYQGGQVEPFYATFIRLDHINRNWINIDQVQIPYSINQGTNLDYSFNVTLQGDNLENSTIDVSAKQR